MCSAAHRVDVVDHRGQRRRLARTGGSRHQHETAALLRDLLQDRRQVASSRDVRSCTGMTRSTSAHRSALLEHVAAEAAQPRHRVGHVDLEVVLELLFLTRAHDAEGHRDGVLLHQPLQIGERQ